MNYNYLNLICFFWFVEMFEFGSLALSGENVAIYKIELLIYTTSCVLKVKNIPYLVFFSLQTDNFLIIILG